MKKQEQHLNKQIEFEMLSKRLKGFENMIKSKNYEIYIKGRTNCIIRNYINEIFNFEQKHEIGI
ncbi:unnamed protein product [Paramecium sonneborni]|uniref:Uncharacterized protein n=1 Tax=Paramecium sonneborni TaxID=65129 RepID=A0A8S1LK24_9CILI|nr:unnamed protein product [Paramecium sonneborni]